MAQRKASRVFSLCDASLTQATSLLEDSPSILWLHLLRHGDNDGAVAAVRRIADREVKESALAALWLRNISRETVSLMQEANENEKLLVKRVGEDPSIPLESLWVKALDSMERWDEEAHVTVTAMIKRLNVGRKLGDDTLSLVLALIHHAMCVDEPIMESEGDSML